jgi:hypothetical protein
MMLRYPWSGSHADNSFYTYLVDVTPQPAFRMNLRGNSIRLKVEYNMIMYNVSIMIMSPCGHIQ